MRLSGIKHRSKLSTTHHLKAMGFRLWQMKGFFMKLKQWLKEYHNMSYEKYKALPDMDRYDIENEFYNFNRQEQIKNNNKNDKTLLSRRPMTEEEKRELDIIFEKERIRYETSLKIGGVDERGNYTALSHRWENEHKFYS